MMSLYIVHCTLYIVHVHCAAGLNALCLLFVGRFIQHLLKGRTARFAESGIIGQT
jgi:hypothetical protein